MQKMLKQKLLGAAIIGVSVLSMIIFRDGTLALLTIPLGAYAVFTKEYVLYDKEDDFK